MPRSDPAETEGGYGLGRHDTGDTAKLGEGASSPAPKEEEADRKWKIVRYRGSSSGAKPERGSSDYRSRYAGPMG